MTKEVFTLWFDHGKRPDNASYQYIVVPGVSVEELEKTSRNHRGIRILSNSSSLQAVKSSRLGICQLVFHKPGEADIGDGLKVRLEERGIVMLEMQGTRVKRLSVSDPSRKLPRITIILPGVYTVEGKGFRTRPDQQQNRTSVDVDLPQGVFAGKSVILDL
jgi:chondroitin AC lyase